MEWETTVEQATVLEKIAPDTLIFLQVILNQDILFRIEMERALAQARKSGSDFNLI